MTRIAATALTAAVLVGGTSAHADRLAFGASLGKTSGDNEESATRGVFARLLLGSRLGVFGELGSARLDNLLDSTWTARRGALGLRLDLGQGRWVPYLLGALGGERWTGGAWDLGVQSDFSIREAGGGIDFAIDTTVSIGLDARLGTRALEQRRFMDDVVIAIVPPSAPIEIEYSSIRAVLSARL